MAGPGCSRATAMPLTLENTRGILHRGGTILGSSRTNVYKVEDGLNKVKQSMKQQASTR